ncbi:hypothetical protein BDV40DRAFT_76735 [Aspergillus tamarii]|uniref:Uncharacterized protein n=1 Tax=Aspergillus tamarii TaxID=41984 RepID=A0A5N6UD23_ASPTM|nr:hypothetical protein BDV40DRAFT_76735 [Aspergillus tamarii]
MRNFYHLQVLHDEDAEARIGCLIPHIENWLNGTLPLPRKEDMRPIGVVIADAKIDIPLRPIRDMIYKGVAEFTLLRTYNDTFTPQNFSKAVYTVLRVDGPGMIGHVKVTLGKSIWIDRSAPISAGLILLISKPAEIIVGRDSSEEHMTSRTSVGLAR